MLAQKTNVAPVKINAFTLIEVLLSLSLGSLILFVFSSLFSQFQIEQVRSNTLLSLQKESHQLMHYFKQHIQHLGYQGNHRENSNFSLFEKEGKRYHLAHSACFIFFYDLNSDGCLGKRATKKAQCINGELNNTKEIAKEIFGFKAENKEIYFFADNKFEHCTKSQCSELLNNCNAKWTKFTSTDHFNVDKLDFSWKGNIMKITLILSKNKLTYENTAYISLLNEA